MSTLLNTDIPYKNWLIGISEKFRHSQIKAATSVNSEMLYPKADKILPQVEEEMTKQELQIVLQVGE